MKSGRIVLNLHPTLSPGSKAKTTDIRTCDEEYIHRTKPRIVKVSVRDSKQAECVSLPRTRDDTDEREV